MNYSRSIDFKYARVVVKGANNKEVKLEWSDVNQLSSTATTGLFHLPLQSESSLFGAPILHLQLTVESVY